HHGLLEDWIVDAGSGRTVPAQRLRYIRWRHGGARYVLDPRRFECGRGTGSVPLPLVERMFFDLKEVLNLNRLYAANPNAVAMQTAAMVYRARGGPQSEGEAQIGWVPDHPSPAKFYLKAPTATNLYLHRQRWEPRFERDTVTCICGSLRADLSGSAPP